MLLDRFNERGKLGDKAFKSFLLMYPVDTQPMNVWVLLAQSFEFLELSISLGIQRLSIAPMI